MVGEKIYTWVKDLFPLNRSLTGPGNRETLKYLSDRLDGMVVHEVPSGTPAFDWITPDEWVVYDAYVEDESRNRLLDFSVNNLHLVGYSHPVNAWMERSELDLHLHSIPDQPDAIPYVTSYYEKRWGFCLTHNQRKKIAPGRYHVVIKVEIKPGVLNYGELVIPGDSSEEIFLSTYICHPSMANNELSGPTVAAALGQWLQSLESRRYTYRLIFIPETIGSIIYLSKHINALKEKVIAGFNITCVGDDRSYSYLPSRNGNTLSDKVALHVLHYIDKNFYRYTWLDRGSDERQYCAPGVDLPIASIMRSKYGEYPEYHTSLDNLDLVSPRGLEGGYNAIRKAIEVIEQNCYLKSTILCEPQLGKRGLYPTLSTKKSGEDVAATLDLISYCDGSRTLLEIAEVIERPFWDVKVIADQLISHGLLVASK